MFWVEELFQLISHEQGGVQLYVRPACDLIDGEVLLQLSHKSQVELKVEKWVKVSGDVNAGIKRDSVSVCNGHSKDG